MQLGSTTFVVAALAIAASAHAETPAAATGDKAVLETAHRMLDGLAKRDKAAMLATMIPEGTATLYRDGKFVTMTLQALAERIEKLSSATADKLEEPIHDAVVHVDDNIAVVWAPYEFLRNGKVDHCGTDIFDMVRRDGRWVIASVTDTSRKTCGAK
jgi:hypothetical protein